MAEEKKEADAVAAYKLQQKEQAQIELWKQYETYQQARSVCLQDNFICTDLRILQWNCIVSFVL